MANAFYCIPDRLIAWDRGSLMPTGIEYFGEMGVVGVIAHEYGHALQWMSGLVDDGTDIWSRNSRPTASPVCTCGRWRRGTLNASR